MPMTPNFSNSVIFLACGKLLLLEMHIIIELCDNKNYYHL